jgi:hypothetical protein
MRNTIRWVTACLLVLLVAVTARAGEDVKLVVVPVAPWEKAGFQRRQDRPWLPFGLAEAVSHARSPETVEIEGRTEFWAVLVDRSGELEGRTVVFRWYHGRPPRPFTEPFAVTVRRRGGFDGPVAWTYAWSDPGGGRRLLSFLGLSSFMSREEWNRSRCYGPRTVRVHAAGGRLLAEASWEIVPAGVTLR